MPKVFPCPNCKGQFQLADDFSGAPILCPFCQKKISFSRKNALSSNVQSAGPIPAQFQPPQTDQLQPLQFNQQPAPSSPMNKNRWLIGSGVLFVGLVIGILVCFLILKKPSVEGLPERSREEKHPDLVVPPETSSWTSYPKTIRLGDIELGIHGIHLPYGSRLELVLKITNHSTTKRATYRRNWGADPLSIRDNFNNFYRVILSDVRSYVQTPAAINPEESIHDRVFFELPIKRAEFLRIEFPGSNVGESRSFRFEFSRESLNIMNPFTKKNLFDP